MYEWCIDGIVIDREDVGEADARLTLYTKEFGRISAKAKSIRKITSKLSAHLGLGDFAKVRLVGKNEEMEHLQLVDALRIRKSDFGHDLLPFLKEVTFDREPDGRLWEVLTAMGKACVPAGRGKQEILQALGLDPALAWCAHCTMKPVNYFLASSHSFACHGCILKIGRNEVSYEL